MPHSFEIRIDDDPTVVLKKVESAITASGGFFEGDSAKGEFAGKSVLGNVKGEYCSVSGNKIRITITDKPCLVSNSMVESEIRKYFA